MTYPKFKLSVLDIGPIRSTQNTAQCVASMIELAKLAEARGYHRYWLAEHHNVAAVVASHTPVLSAAIGAATTDIRIGGCILLPHYPPFLVAEQMALLEACNPGRVDLGIGRSSGADGIASSLLRGAREPNGGGHPQQVADLMAMIQPEGVELDLRGNSYTLRAAPGAASAPAIWLLGTSRYSAQLAAAQGLPYAFGYHIQGEGAREAIALYRSQFVPSRLCEKPKVIMSAIVVIGDTLDEAERLARSQLYFMSGFRSGEAIATQMLVEEADTISFPARYDALVEMFRRTWIIADAKGAAAKIATLVETFGIDEFMVNPVAAAYRDDDPCRAPNRERTIAALADAFN